MAQTIAAEQELGELKPNRGRRFGDFWSLFVESRMGPIGLGILLIVALMAICAPLIAPDGPFKLGAPRLLAPGEEGHLLGTDHLGRDMLAQIVYGARVSLIIGIVAASISMLVGLIIEALPAILVGQRILSSAASRICFSLSRPSS